jgi:hypothetical protein
MLPISGDSRRPPYDKGPGMLSTTSNRIGRIVTTIVFATAIALGQATPANAEKELDLELYDYCMSHSGNTLLFVQLQDACCQLAGGTPTNTNDAVYHDCAAPPAEQEDSSPQPPQQPPGGPAQQPGQPPVLSPDEGGTAPSDPIQIQPVPAQIG